MIPLRQFRAQHNLPETFSVEFFEPKDYTGLADIRHAAPQLNQLRQMVLNVCPKSLTLETINQLAQTFRAALEKYNPSIGLKPVEIDYAVAGFSDVLQAFLYACLRANAEKMPPPAFDTVYQTWLNDSQRVAAREFPYNDWIVQIIHNAYGRVGLLVRFPDGRSIAVADNTLACPAERFTFHLLQEIVEQLTE
ncbi:MAG: hypothetical protein CUN56_12240 [Phototrophicales bacterium]|nr:MAG: hypothetical protein CUN56_12240 [Phototrophicales bacterium]RMG77708.1 MAG: hypothetical protein D6711_00865 [Chloroflexota bacterium]